jgi:hypothetical protein
MESFRGAAFDEPGPACLDLAVTGPGKPEQYRASETELSCGPELADSIAWFRHGKGKIKQLTVTHGNPMSGAPQRETKCVSR